MTTTESACFSMYTQKTSDTTKKWCDGKTNDATKRMNKKRKKTNNTVDTENNEQHGKTTNNTEKRNYRTRALLVFSSSRC